MVGTTYFGPRPTSSARGLRIVAANELVGEPADSGAGDRGCDVEPECVQVAGDERRGDRTDRIHRHAGDRPAEHCVRPMVPPIAIAAASPTARVSVAMARMTSRGGPDALGRVDPREVEPGTESRLRPASAKFGSSRAAVPSSRTATSPDSRPSRRPRRISCVGLWGTVLPGRILTRRICGDDQRSRHAGWAIGGRELT